MLNLASPINQLSRIGPRNLPRLKKLGIKTVRNLLWHFPVRYEDYSNIVPIARLKTDERASILGQVINIENIHSWKRRIKITKAVISDNSDKIRAVWFNQPYIAGQLKVGTAVSIAGKVAVDKEGIYFSSPIYEKINPQTATTTHTGRLVSKYPETDGITSKYLRFLIKQALGRLNQAPDPIPQNILQKYLFPGLKTALWEVHFPASLESAQKAKDRLSFEELLLFQIKALQTRRSLSYLAAPKIVFQNSLIRTFVDALPFKLTSDQKIAAFEILKDLGRSFPMNRLLNGDVGSGKTVVALIAAYQVVKAGFQAVFMAPTEILAQQHFKTINSLIGDTDVKPILLTSSSKNKKDISRQIAGGFVNLVVGTHAVIQKNIKFGNLGLVIIDEQHRFGVSQRSVLAKAKSKEQRAKSDLPQVPHLLSMTATPIPRTLALTIYGDLDISLIRELPPGRQEVITKIISPQRKKKAYEFLEDEIKKGRQVFLICPRIEPDDPARPIRQARGRQNKMNLLWQEVKAVTDEYDKISKEILPHRRVAMLHGKMKPKEKEKIMADFKNGLHDILVSTSVIEVGVDIPNATVMAIENAERFGLAQIHQFRGRVGRGEHQSYCLLICGTNQDMENKRLEALLGCNDGFKLAEKDLQIRGPGQFLGTQQSGIADLSMASLANLDLIKKARLEAKLLLKSDPNLSNYPQLRAQLISFQKLRHFE